MIPSLVPEYVVVKLTIRSSTKYADSTWLL